jgi:hypothetical protein
MIATATRTLPAIERIHDLLLATDTPERLAAQADHPAATMILNGVIAGTVNADTLGDRAWTALENLLADLPDTTDVDEDDHLSAPNYCPEHGPVTWDCCPDED